MRKKVLFLLEFQIEPLGTSMLTRRSAWPERAPSRPIGIGGFKEHNMNDITMPGSPALWTGSFTSPERLPSASFWRRGFAQTGVTLHTCSPLHRSMKFLILNKDSKKGNECSEMLRKVVGARGFEPPTPDTPCQCATRLRYAPINHESPV
jgi:hypothetical protein